MSSPRLRVQFETLFEHYQGKSCGIVSPGYDSDSFNRIRTEVSKAYGKQTTLDVIRAQLLRIYNSQQQGSTNGKSTMKSPWYRSEHMLIHAESKEMGTVNDPSLLNAMLLSDGTIGYQVEAIVGRKTSKGTPLYLVKWKGYPTSHNTWEPLAHLEECMALVKAFDTQRSDRR